MIGPVSNLLSFTFYPLSLLNPSEAESPRFALTLQITLRALVMLVPSCAIREHHPPLQDPSTGGANSLVIGNTVTRFQVQTVTEPITLVVAVTGSVLWAYSLCNYFVIFLHRLFRISSFLFVSCRRTRLGADTLPSRSARLDISSLLE